MPNQDDKSQKKYSSIATQLSIRIVLMILISTMIVGGFGLLIYRGSVIDINAQKAKALAQAMAAGIDGDSFEQAFITGEKDEQWAHVKERADATYQASDIKYLYILSSIIVDGNVVYYAEGYGSSLSDEENFEFGALEPVDIYPEELFTVIETGEPVSTNALYDGGEFGYLLTGFAPILNSNGDVVGLIGIDITMQATMNAVNMFALKSILMAVGCSIVFALLSVFYIRRRIKKPIVAVANAAKKLSAGDNNVQVSYGINDEFGTLIDSFEAMIKSTKDQIAAFKKISEGDLSVDVSKRGENDELSFVMSNTLENIKLMVNLFRKSADELNQSAIEIAGGANSFAREAGGESLAIEGIVKSVAQITSNTQENTEKAAEATKIIQEMEESARNGYNQMESMVSAVSEIQKSFDSITVIVSSIEAIAFQTNILALNAAVEAARAGQSGKGFAVVAEEVGTLATKSSTSARSTEQLITEARDSVKRGVDVATEATRAFDELVVKIRQGGELLGAIADASKRQGTEIVSINSDIERVNNMMKRTANAAESSAQIGETLSAKAQQLTAVLEQYKITE